MLFYKFSRGGLVRRLLTKGLCFSVVGMSAGLHAKIRQIFLKCSEVVMA